MGYLDGLTSSSFKTTADGRTLFYPFGMMGRGYEVVSEADRTRLRSQIKVWFILALVIGIGAVRLGYPANLIVIAVWSLGYIGWTRYAVRGIRQSDERLSARESLAAQANAYGPVTLWMMEIGALAFVVGGFFILGVDPGHWLAATAAVVFFGACALVFGYLLVLRGRA